MLFLYPEHPQSEVNHHRNAPTFLALTGAGAATPVGTRHWRRRVSGTRGPDGRLHSDSKAGPGEYCKPEGHDGAHCEGELQAVGELRPGLRPATPPGTGLERRWQPRTRPLGFLGSFGQVRRDPGWKGVGYPVAVGDGDDDAEEGDAERAAQFEAVSDSAQP
jgi:hypothetical protein